MSDSTSWSLPLGRWWRVHVRVHALFVAVAVFILFLSTSGPGHPGAGYGALFVVILLASVIVHELGHSLAAVRVGGNPDHIVIGPLGGLTQIEVPRERDPELIVAATGPAVNLAIVLGLLPVLVLTGAGVTGLLSPLEPVDLITGAWWLVAVKAAFWINWLLLSVNLLPAFPFDGARLLRALLWPALDYRYAGQIAVRTSKLAALVICIVAWFVRDERPLDVLPAWVPLTLFAALVYFSAQQEAARLDEGDWGEELFNYDFSQGYTSLERNPEAPRRNGGMMRRWLANRRELRRRRRESQEQDEERQVDDILTRLHEKGMDGLSAKERALLHRVSARYRNRQRN
jgi:Zn-dependent protease